MSLLLTEYKGIVNFRLIVEIISNVRLPNGLSDRPAWETGVTAMIWLTSRFVCFEGMVWK